MFTTKSNAEVVAKTFRRAGTLPQPIGKKLLLDLVRYDSVRLATSLASVNLPVMAIQSTYSNEQREVSIRGMPPGRGLYPGDRLGSMT
jgi:hypothetical protein